MGRAFNGHKLMKDGPELTGALSYSRTSSDGMDRCWRRRNERYADCCINEVDRWGGGGLMV